MHNLPQGSRCFSTGRPPQYRPGPDTWNTGLEILVGIDVVALVECLAGVRHLKDVCIGDSAGGHEQGVWWDRPLAVGRGDFDRNLLALRGYPLTWASRIMLKRRW